MPDEPTTAPQRRRLLIAVAASESDRGAALQVAASLGKLQLDILFLDLSASPDQIKQQLAMAEVCLVFVSPAIEGSRPLSAAIETAILLYREFKRPVVMPIWMGPYVSEEFHSYGLQQFRSVEWRGGEDTTELVRELLSRFSAGRSLQFEWRDLSVAEPWPIPLPRPISAPDPPPPVPPPPPLPPVAVEKPEPIGELEPAFDPEDLDTPTYQGHGARTSSPEPPPAPAPAAPRLSEPEPPQPSAPQGRKSSPAGRASAQWQPDYQDYPARALPRRAQRTSQFQRLYLWARRRVAGWRMEPTTDLPEGSTVDNVNLTVTSPANLGIGQVHEVRFWAHLEVQTATVVARALAALAVLDPRKLLVKTEGPFRVARGTALEITVSIEGIVLLDRSKAIIWTGEIGCAAFLVKVPDQCTAGPKPGSASIRVAGTEIAKLSFVLQVGNGSARARRVQTGIRRHSTAFASYASEDRDAVLARIQVSTRARLR